MQKRLPYMTPEWKSAFRYAIQTADQLGMEATIASSPGWSETGGPWVAPSEAMKKMVWSETRVLDGQALPIVLPHPPTVAGVFQDLAADKVNSFYQDVAVLAFPTPLADVAQPVARITASHGAVDPKALSDGQISVAAASVTFNNAEQTAWIQFEYSKPIDIQAASIATLGDGIGMWAQDNSSSTFLSGSEDGVHFEKIIDLPGAVFRSER